MEGGQGFGLLVCCKHLHHSSKQNVFPILYFTPEKCVILTDYNFSLLLP